MAETIDDRWVINRALNRIGSAGIGAIDEDTSLARQARATYYDRVDFILALHEWSFNAKTYRLDELALEPENDYDADAKKFINGWRYAFTMTGDRLGNPRRVLRDPRRPADPLREFLVEGATLYADFHPLWATFGVRASPAVWLAPARLAIIVATAADLAVPVSHDVGLAKDLRAQALGPDEMKGRGGLVASAIEADRAGNASAKPRIWHDPLTDARFA